MANNRLDLIHVNGPFGLLYAGLPARARDAPVVFTSHLAEDADTAFKRWLMRTFPSRILAVSATVADRLSRAGIPGSRLEQVPLGVDAREYAFDATAREEIRWRRGWKPEDVVFASIGRIQRVKGQTRFLEAFARARSHNSNIVALLVGARGSGEAADDRNYERELEDRVRQVEENGARVCRQPPTDRIAALLSAIDVLVVASDSESFGRIVLEAMACGRPVIATPCGGPQETVVDRQTGLVAKSFDPEALAEAMVALAEDPGKRAEMGACGRRRVEEEFSLQTQARRTVEVYESLLRPL